MWENAIDEVIDADILVLNEELREIVRGKRRKRGRKCRNWIGLRGLWKGETYLPIGKETLTF